MNKETEKELQRARIPYTVRSDGETIYFTPDGMSAGKVIEKLVCERYEYEQIALRWKNKFSAISKSNNGDAYDAVKYGMRKISDESIKEFMLSRDSDKSGSSTAAKHYQLEIQPITVMQADMSKERFCGYLQGNVLKYVLRYQHKGGNEDLGKAMQYLYWLKLVELGKKIDPMKDTVELKEV